MSSNGQRRPPRPRIEFAGGSPSPDEAAALVAAIEQFLAATAPAPAAASGRPKSAWHRSALLEGAQAKQALVSPWGEPRGWGALR